MEILIWKLRTQKGYSCRTLSDKCGISKSTINNIENEKVSPTLAQLELIARALDCHIVDLFKE
ncbi:helix-turn-helix domain-containing protein [uncultured Eubacterium sp.]|jgi:DNA-binding XRE family transcriptional regulator|uniref:helix-turn-helix domain-containing protein n=1 Tax=uncultured Eubacterium sp. TaxID=165185 RepID=UPI0026DB1A61|nr:helix-turn-helix transcriptional regulator [uncultured Eubacterium sp.]